MQECTLKGKRILLPVQLTAFLPPPVSPTGRLCGAVRPAEGLPLQQLLALHQGRLRSGCSRGRQPHHRRVPHAEVNAPLFPPPCPLFPFYRFPLTPRGDHLQTLSNRALFKAPLPRLQKTPSSSPRVKTDPNQTGSLQSRRAEQTAEEEGGGITGLHLLPLVFVVLPASVPVIA